MPESPAASAVAETERRTFALLAGLYVSQFLGVGFFVTGLSAILRDQGASLEQLGVVTGLGALWAVKFLWAPLVDRFDIARLGHYRGWLVILQPVIALMLLALISVDPMADFNALILIAAVVVLLSATQDIAADALAVRLLGPEQRGIGNGIQIAGGYVGNILGGGVVLIVYNAWGWTAAIVALAAFTILPLWQILAFSEPAMVSERLSLRAAFGIVGVPGIARWTLLLLPLQWMGISAAYALVSPMLVDIGWSVGAVGIVNNIVGGVAAIASALGAGWLVRRSGRRRMLVLFGVAQAAAILLLLPLGAGTDSGALAVTGVLALHAAYAAAATVVNTVNMDLCRPAVAGSDFTMLASFAFLTAIVAGGLGLVAAESVGYPSVLLASAMVALLSSLATSRWFANVAGTDPLPAATMVNGTP
ncbi:MAG: MFS transporter [Nocardioides sp.]